MDLRIKESYCEMGQGIPPPSLRRVFILHFSNMMHQSPTVSNRVETTTTDKVAASSLQLQTAYRARKLDSARMDINTDLLDRPFQGEAQQTV